MKELDKLLVSLATVIIGYHDHYLKPPLITPEATPEQTEQKTRLLAVKLLKDVRGQLEPIIKKFDQEDRRPFLDHIKDVVVFLQRQQQKDSSFDKDQLKLYQQQIERIFNDFITLLKTPKKSKTSVTVPGTERTISLSGALDAGTLYSNPCESGKQLIKLLANFDLTADSTPEDVTKEAASICKEQQNTLLLPELQRQLKAQQKTIDALQKSMQASAEQKSEIEALRADILAIKQQAFPDPQKELKGLRADIAALQEHIHSQQDAIKPVSSLQTRVQALEKHKPSSSSPQISTTELKSQIDAMRGQIDALNQEILALKTPSSSEQSSSEQQQAYGGSALSFASLFSAPAQQQQQRRPPIMLGASSFPTLQPGQYPYRK